jgi:hypothetical protein
MGTALAAMPESDSSDEGNSECQSRANARPEYVKIQNEKRNQTEAAPMAQRSRKSAYDEKNPSCRQRSSNRNGARNYLQQHPAGVQAQCQAEEDVGATTQFT